MSLVYTYDGSVVAYQVAPSGLSITNRADMGEAGSATIPVEDPSANKTIVGHKPFIIEDTECAQPVLFRGWTTQRDIGRSLDLGMFVGANARVQDITLVDLNACLDFRIITRTGAGGGNRPAETWAERLTWILESEYLSDWIPDDQTFVVVNATAMDATDYRGSTPRAVMQDLSERSGGAYTFFVFWDPISAAVRLFFDNDSEVISACTLAISNVVADIDSTVTFAPDAVTVLQREPDQVYSDVCVEYFDGTKKLYRSRPSTYATYVRRSATIQRPYTKGLATATAQAEKWLDKHSVETDRITCTIRVPAASVGLIEAGQSIAARFSHLGLPYSAAGGATMRIVSCSPKPTDDTGYWYDVSLELVYRPTITAVPNPVTDWVFDANTGSHGLWAAEIVGPTTGDVPEFGGLEWQNGSSFAVGAVPGYGLTVAGVGHGGSVATAANAWTKVWDEVALGQAAVLTNDASGTLGSPIATFGAAIDWGGGWVAFPAGSTIRQTKAYDHALTGEGTTLTFDTAPLDDSFILVFQASGSWFGGGLTVPGIPDGWTTLATYIERENWGTNIDCRFVYHLGTTDPSGSDTVIDLGPTPGATTPHPVDPTVDDDETLGYTTAGMLWVNTTTGDTFVLVDGTDGAADWNEITGAGVTDHGALTGLADDDHTQYVLKRYGGKEVVSTVAATGATETIDLANGNVFDETLTADCTFTFAGATAGVACSFTLLLRQDGTGGWTTTWPGSVVWADGTAPTLDETASTVAVLTFFSLDGGTVWYGFPTGGGGGGTPATTVTDETTWGITPAVGSDTEYARQDHTHGSPAAPAAGGIGPLLISDDHSAPIVFADILQASDGSDFLYASEP